MSKVWFITGSSRGLGRDLVTAALAAGDRVVATARKPEQLRDMLAGHADRSRAVALDVTDPGAARTAISAAVSAFGRIDVIVNNAGYANINSIEDVGDDDFREQVETNFFGVVNVTRAALPVLRAQRGGHIIQIASIGGRFGTPGLAAYQASKWAVEGFSEVLSFETQPFGVHVTIVEPGGMRTDWGGSSMRIDEISAPYQPSVGASVAGLRAHVGTEYGDPVKAARAILRLADEPNPPLRLLLGSDAVYLAGLVGAGRAAEDARWKELSMSTDFDGLVDFAQTPIAKALAAMRR